MRLPADKPIHIGRQYRTKKELSLLIHDYDQMVIKRAKLPADRIFQPWEPHDAWRGKKVPITLGDGASEFDWGISTGECCFIDWNDFFSNCRLADVQGVWGVIIDLSDLFRFKRVGQSKRAGAQQDDLSSSRQVGFISSRELFDKDGGGRTRLFYAAERGDQKGVETMIFRFPGTGFYPQRLGFIESKDEQGLTAADVAEQSGHKELAEYLRHQAWFMETYG